MRTLGGLLVALTLTLATGSASASPPPQIAEEPVTTTLVEWSTWLRGGIVFAANGSPDANPARETMPPVDDASHDHAMAAVGALGAGFTLPIRQRFRVGPFAELRERGGLMFGGELLLLGEPGGLDLFQFDGTAAVGLRLGMNEEIRSAQLNVSYRAPWDLWGPQPRSHRYIIGASVVMAVAQSRTDPSDWSMTWGIEFEPVGALRYILGIRSWY